MRWYLALRTCVWFHSLLPQLSSLGTFPFFVENINLLQLSALRLVRAVSDSLLSVLLL